jgi:hypothetical protein
MKLLKTLSATCALFSTLVAAPVMAGNEGTMPLNDERVLIVNDEGRFISGATTGSHGMVNCAASQPYKTSHHYMELDNTGRVQIFQLWTEAYLKTEYDYKLFPEMMPSNIWDQMSFMQKKSIVPQSTSGGNKTWYTPIDHGNRWYSFQSWDGSYMHDNLGGCTMNNRTSSKHASPNNKHRKFKIINLNGGTTAHLIGGSLIIIGPDYDAPAVVVTTDTCNAQECMVEVDRQVYVQFDDKTMTFPWTDVDSVFYEDRGMGWDNQTDIYDIRCDVNSICYGK